MHTRIRRPLDLLALYLIWVFQGATLKLAPCRGKLSSNACSSDLGNRSAHLPFPETRGCIFPLVIKERANLHLFLHLSLHFSFAIVSTFNFTFAMFSVVYIFLYMYLT